MRFSNIVSGRVILEIVGIQFVTAVLMFGVSDAGLSRSITLPFRIIVLLVTIFTFLFVKKKGRLTKEYLLFLLFFVSFTIRIILDIFFGNVVVADPFQLLLFLLVIELPSLVILFFTSKYIQYGSLSSALYYILAFSTVFVAFDKGLSLFRLVELDSRISGSVALSTISLGHMSVSLIIFSFLYIHKSSGFKLLVGILTALLGILVMLASGSKGPIFSLVVVAVFALVSSLKTFRSRLMVILLAFSLFILLIKPLLELINAVAPYLGNRLSNSYYNKDLGGREIYYARAKEEFFSSPVIGPGFQIKVNGKFDYAHNIFWDIALGTGLLGSIIFLIICLMLFRRAFGMIGTEKTWVSLLFIQFFSFHIWSGAFYIDPLFILLTGLVSLHE